MATHLIENEVLDVIGDAASVAGKMDKFRENVRQLSSAQPRLIDTYPKQWVALYNGEVAATGSTFASVMSAISQKGLPRDTVIVRFIEKNHRTMIL